MSDVQNSKPSEENTYNAPGSYKMGESKGGFIGCAVPVLVLAFVGALGLFFFKNTMGERERVDTLAKEAEKISRSDDFAGLAAAKAKYTEIGDVLNEDKTTLAMAELSSLLYSQYGVASSKAPAEQYVDASTSRGLESAERYVADAYLKIAKGEAGLAEDRMTAMAKQGVRDARIYHALAESLLAQGRAREAQKAVEDGIRIKKGLYRLHTTHARTLIAQGKYAGAASALQQILQSNSGHVDARAIQLLLQTIARNGKPDRIDKEVSRLKDEIGEIGLAAPKLDALLTYISGLNALNQGQVQNAIQAANTAIANDATLIDAMILKGDSLARLGKYAEAKASYEQANAVSPTNIRIGRSAFTSLHRGGQGELGVAILEKIMNAEPNNGNIYPPLAIAYAKIGKVEAAKTTAEKAIEKLGDGHADALFAKARALQAAKNSSDAQKTYQEALAAKKGGPWADVYYEMGWLRMSEKDYESADAAFKMATETWEKKRARVDLIADGYDAWAGALEAYRGRQKKVEIQKMRAKAKKLRVGT